jgi:adenosylmethionine-8-amino-7-oxononanoate aminotransferase
MVLMPPLCMTVDQLDQVLAALELSIVDVLGA